MSALPESGRSLLNHLVDTAGQLPFAGTEDALGSSLQKLPSGERGWITMTQAAALFSHEKEQYAFGELDEDGKTRLAQFALQYRSMPDFRPTEGRMYFKKS